MFAIALQQKQYKTYTLSDLGFNSSINVVPERGGIITSWCINNQELLYFDSKRLENPELIVRGGIPILFPICGNLPNNIYEYNGNSYSLKQHGFARELPWEVIEKSTQDRASITLVLTSNKFTKTFYPFDFKLTFTYQVKGNSLEIFQVYTNLSNTQRMPFSTGLHPYFFAPNKYQLHFDIPSMQYVEPKTGIVHDNNGKFDLNQDEVNAIFEKLTGLATTVYDRSRGLKIILSYTSSYSTMAFWIVKNEEFYCLEPWTAPPNSLNTGYRLIDLEPGSSCEMLVRLTATFL
ncbi:MAG: aldose epimerase [Okeania sp. SIO2C9]|uniref:aldose epimerase family protein n=1 Tax=Okeania sp. SIO2C9 TaxID=2607791 RepID=UPI0013BF7C3D|nr:aldose epimerase [Okeania sp. SIO2C9]NEQ74512.1 aldose epimerase [Okeania sp. SIO2C9]